MGVCSNVIHFTSKLLLNNLIGCKALSLKYHTAGCKTPGCVLKSTLINRKACGSNQPITTLNKEFNINIYLLKPVKEILTVILNHLLHLGV